MLKDLLIVNLVYWAVAVALLFIASSDRVLLKWGHVFVFSALPASIVALALLG